MSREKSTSPPSIELPKLRADLERSRRLAQRAVDRARRVAGEAQATRRLLEARLKQPRDGGSLENSIWDAAARELVRMSQERDRQLGLLAHELRQPLAAALAAERLLAVDGDGPAAARAQAILGRQLRHLSELIDNLLDYSRLVLEAAALAHDTVDMNDVVGAAVETVEAAATERGIVLRTSRWPGSTDVRGDGARLRQAIINLLQNAVRYTPRGGRIDVDVTRAEDKVVVQVRDSGEGLPADSLEAIFEPFVRLANAGPGLGIGLALVRRVAEVHGGHVVAESSGPGTGSTFRLLLPEAGEGRD